MRAGDYNEWRAAAASVDQVQRGIHAAHALRNAGVRITVIDRTNHSVFQPLLYQVATAGLSGEEIGLPIRYLLRHQRNAEVLMAEAKSVDLEQRLVEMGRRRPS